MKSPLPAPNEYLTDKGSAHFEALKDSGSYYFNFHFSWGTSYDRSMYYKRMQLQYRFASQDDNLHLIENLPDTAWHNIGEKYPRDIYTNGFVTVPPPFNGFSINAHHFPKGLLEFRYRMIHDCYEMFHENNTPGIPENTELVLASKWSIVSISNLTFENPDGFRPEEGGEFGCLVINLSLPTSSWYVSHSGTAIARNGYNKVASISLGESGKYYLPKPTAEGQWEVSVKEIYSSGIKPTMNAVVSGLYDRNTKELLVQFTTNDFRTY